jgi:copper chaperone CopZ
MAAWRLTACIATLTLLAGPAQAAGFRFQSPGITCLSCAGKVKKALSTSAAVASVDIDPDSLKVTVKLRPGAKLTEEELKDLMAPTSYQVGAIEKLD